MPARRTTRGIQKRYVEELLIFDDEDDEAIAIPESKDDDADFDAQLEVQQTLDDDDDDEEEEEVEEHAVAVPSSDEDDDDEDMSEKMGDAKGPAAKPKKQRNTGAGMIQSRKGFHDIPHYPLETRIVTRVYAGPLRRYARYSALRDAMYGPEYHRIKIIWDLEIRWANYPVLPPRLPPEHSQGIMPSPWVPRTNERDQAKKAAAWYDHYRLDGPEQQWHIVEDGPDLVPRANGGLVTLVGPYDRQKEYMLEQGDNLSISPNGFPVADQDANDKTPSGWMFDVGGIPLAVSWAPKDNRTSQVLAIATIPFSDQESNPSGEVNMNKTAMTTGSVQLWEFLAEDTQDGLATPSTKPPRFLGAKCFDWGRPKRLQFCPVAMNSANLYDTYGMLAVLCSDGRVRILDTNAVHDALNPIFEWMDSPVVTFGLSNDYNVEITCLTWVNTNRIAFGHTDGSITLWSVYPRKLLQRHGVHTTYVIDICSAYPSSPSLVASIPVGGCATLTDLYQPSSEFTYFPVPAISFQPNLLCWNESMQGFMALYPSSTPNTTIAFLHHRFFCQARSICTGPNTLTCVSAGSTHPFILVGCADGSVFSCNALQKLFKQKGEPLRKIKVFEHEYKPIEFGPEDHDVAMAGGAPRPRGAVRILQGFLPEVNDDPRTEKRKEMDRKKRLERKNNGKKRGRPRKNAADDQIDEEEDREGELEERLASRVVTHEPLTRVTAVAWNPNTHFSCWAVCAMGSGLIKIMDLGVE